MVRGPVRVGLWGTFDVANFGDGLLAHVSESELGNRLPIAVFERYSPLGWARFDPFDEGRPARPLGPWTETQVARLAADVDAVVIGGGEIIHVADEFLAPHYGVEAHEMVRRAPSRFFIDGLGPHERDVPVFWHAVGVPFDLSGPGTLPADDGWRRGLADLVRDAVDRRRYTTVRDERSRQRVMATGVLADCVTVVPDPALVLDRLFDAGVLERRLAFLRALGWYPPGPAVVVNGNRSLIPFVDELAVQLRKVMTDLGDAEVVVLETSRDHGDAVFADELAARLDEPPWRLPAAVGLADVVTAVAHADLFIGSSLHGNVTAFVHDTPHVVLDLTGQSKLRSLTETLEATQNAITDVDDLFAAASNALAAPRPPALLAALQQRVDDHFTRLADEIVLGVEGRRDRRADEGTPAGYRRVNDLEREVLDLRTSLERRAEHARRAEVRLLERLAEHRTTGAELAAAQAELAEARAVVATIPGLVARAQQAVDMEELVDTVFRTKTMRLAGPGRRLWGRWLRITKRR
jgi:hypothetical protein